MIPQLLRMIQSRLLGEEDSFALKCRVNGISVRTLTRGRLERRLIRGGGLWPRSVEAMPIPMKAPVFNGITTGIPG